MALPVPRSYQQILGDMLRSFVADTGFEGFRIGGPLLSVMESAAQSDLRSTQDIFGMLDAADLDRAVGIALDNAGRSDGVTRFTAAPATGKVSIYDTSFTKRSTTIYTGVSAPVAGSLYINVADASNWPATGQLYIGRGTQNLEGPLDYTAVAAIGSYWRITLDALTPTSNFHNLGESVTLAQGGERVIGAGTSVQTPQGVAAEAVQFTTDEQVVLEDGEDELHNVKVTASAPGVIGNVPVAGISGFGSPPFSGAAVTNLLPFTNGSETESDNEYRERIRDARASRAKATPLAIKNAILGLEAPDESARVVSASVVSETGRPTSVYIDNGLGYEQVDVGVAIDTLVSGALGGETLFQVSSPRPISKAFAKTGATAPFGLRSGDILAIKVGGTLYEHTFSAEDFKDIGTATAYEVVASINGNSALGFAARMADSATGFSVFAKADTLEDLDVQVPTGGTDANDAFDLPTGRIDTLKLYKNDRLLYKDGQVAKVVSAPKSTWASMATGETLIVAVDGTSAITHTITDADFVATGLAVAVSSSNTLAAWAAVFNAKIPGITCTVEGDRLVLTSNRGPSGSALVSIDVASTLVTKGMWTAAYGLSDTGRENDYTFNRAIGQGRLSVALAEGDTLTAGTPSARAYVQSGLYGGSITLPSAGKFWYVADGAAEIIATDVTPSTALTVTNETEVYGATNVYYIKYASAALPFTAVEAGDWMILWDTSFNAANRVCRPVAFTSGAGAAVYVQVPSASGVGETVAPALGGITFVRTRKPIHEVSVSAGTYTVDQLVTYLESLLVGVEASSWNNDALRLTTNTNGTNGDIMVITADVNGQLLDLPTGELVSNETVHYASAETTYRDGAVPYFGLHTDAATITSTDRLTATSLLSDSGNLLCWLQPWEDGATARRWGNNRDRQSIIDEISGTTVYYRDADDKLPVSVGDRFYYGLPLAIGPLETIGVTLNNDPVTQNYQIPLYRTIQPVAGSTYGATFGVKDLDNGSADLSDLFGTTFSVQDFCLYMRARTKVHGTSAANKGILWRFGRYGSGPEGDLLLAYANPHSPSAAATAAVVNDASTLSGWNGEFPVLEVRLPSGPARTVSTLHKLSKFTVSQVHTGVNAGNGADIYTVRFTEASHTALIGELTRTANVVSIINMPAAFVSGINIGDLIWVACGDPNYPSGPKIVTAKIATSISYNEVGTGVASLNAATVTFTPSALDLTNVVVGDVVAVQDTDFAAQYNNFWTVSAKGANWFEFKTIDSTLTAVTTPTGILDTANLRFYPITATTSSALAAAVSAAVPGLLTGVEIEDGGGVPGSGNITEATTTEYLNDTATDWKASFYDGVNWVKSSNFGVSPNTITLKESVTASLGSNSDFDNEVFYLVPRYTHTLQRWLNSPAVTGLYGSGSVLATSSAGKLQIGTQAAGSAGAVQVSGGLANSVSVPVQGAADGNATAATTTMLVKKDEAGGLVSGSMARVRATVKGVKPVAMTTAETLAIAASGSNWELTSSVTNFWASLWACPDAVTWRVEKHGDFVALAVRSGGTSPTLPASVMNGSWLYVDAVDAAAGNTGWFRVVGYSQSQNTIYIENANAVEEDFVVDTLTDDMQLYDMEKAIVGDFFEIPDSTMDANNKGVWEIVGLGTTTKKIIVSGAGMSAKAATALPAATASLYRVREGSYASFVVRLGAIYESPEGADWLNVVGGSDDLAPWISEARGSVIEPLGKLGFPTTLERGTDGYAYTGGLIGECARVLYGDESDPDTYPGVVAAGTEVEIKGPLVKRVSVALQIRLRSGTDSATISNNVKSAVATVINSSPLGTPIAISDIVEAANRVDGVVSVVVTSPTYGTSNDLISVQDYEKPFVLDIESDVTVKIVGN